MPRVALVALVLLTACASGSGNHQNNNTSGSDGAVDAAQPQDARVSDSGVDAAPPDAIADAEPPDGAPDAIADAAPPDAGPDAGGTCVLPTEACAAGAEDRDTCATARVLSRAALPFDETGIDIAGAGDDAAPTCIPHDTEQKDHFYRIFLQAGETLSVRAWPVAFEGFNVVLALYHSATPCSTIECAVEERCVNAYNDASSDTPEAFVFTAAEPGWFVISVDSRQITGTQYRLRVEVDCVAPCGC